MSKTGGYRRRILDSELDELLLALPAIAIEGAKGVGKTASAEQRASEVFRLDVPAERSAAETNPVRLVSRGQAVLIDEWQYVPELWDRVRRAVDAGAAPGSFLLTGSSSGLATGTHSGAGRIVSLQMRPLAFAERHPGIASVSLRDLLTGARPAVDGASTFTVEDYTDEILASGFPGLRGLTGASLTSQLDGYLRRIVDRDFPELGHSVRNPAALRRWMAAYGAATATTVSFEKIRDAATGGEDRKPAKSTVQPYRDVLERLFIIDSVPAWQPTQHRIRELGQPPKHHLVDPALAARLVRAEKGALLAGGSPGPVITRDGSLLGALFESLVTQSLRVYAEAVHGSIGHLRTHRGDHEVDLIVERDDGRVIAVEVKLGATPGDREVRHLHWLAEQVGDEILDAVVVTTGTTAYRRSDGIAVVPAALLGP